MNPILKAVFLFIILFSSIQLCEPDNLKLISRWSDGPCNTVYIENNYAYINNGSAFQILDISDTSNVHEIGKIDLADYINNIKIQGGYAYIAASKGIYVLDLKDMSHPRLINSTLTENQVNSILVKDNFLYAALDNVGLEILEVQDPSNPRLTGIINTSSSATGLFLKDTLLFVTCPDSGLFAIDVQNKSNPVLTGYYNFNRAYSPQSIFIKDSIAFVTSSEKFPGFRTASLHLLDIKDPSKIFERSSVKLYGDWWAEGNQVQVNGSYAYLTYSSDIGNFLSVIDVSSPDSAKFVSRKDVNRVSGLSIKGNLAFVTAEHYGLLAFDLSNPKAIRQVTYFRTAGDTRTVFKDGNYLYVANSKGGLKVLLFSEPGYFSNVFSYSRQFGYEACNSLYVKDNVLYSGFSGNSYGLVNFSLKDMPHIVKIGELFPADITNIIVKGNYEFATNYYGFSIYNVSDPSHPSAVFSYSTGEVRDPEIAVEDTLLFVAAKTSGVLIFNVSNPSKATLVDTIAVKYASGIAVNNNYVYMSSFGEGLRVYNIADLKAPKEISGIKDSLYATKIRVHEGYAFVVYPNLGLKILNLQKPDSVYMMKFIKIERNLSDLFIDSDYIITAEGQLGFSVYKNDITSEHNDNEKLSNVKEYSLFQNYPNPFNPSTTISYSIPKESYVELKVFDMLGSEVSSLVNEKQGAGQYKVQFNGSLLPSGVYIYTLQAGEHRDSKKLLLLK